MRRRTWRASAGALAVVGLLVGAAPAAATRTDVLVFSGTEDFRHESIDDGRRMIRSLGRDRNWRVTVSDDSGRFTRRGLRRFEVVVFLSTNREVLDDAQQQALERHIRAGGGWVGIHGAADTEYGWPFYGNELLGGAWFDGHPPIQAATVIAEDERHLSTRHLRGPWRRSDEWYAFTVNPRARARVLLRVDESSYEPADTSMGSDHPIAWTRRVGRGRSWFTAMGHTRASYAEPRFRRHVLGGILSVSRR